MYTFKTCLRISDSIWFMMIVFASTDLKKNDTKRFYSESTSALAKTKQYFCWGSGLGNQKVSQANIYSKMEIVKWKICDMEMEESCSGRIVHTKNPEILTAPKWDGRLTADRIVKWKISRMGRPCSCFYKLNIVLFP